QERNTASVDDPAEHVTPEAIGPQRMLPVATLHPDWRDQLLRDVALGGALRRQVRREHGRDGERAEGDARNPGELAATRAHGESVGSGSCRARPRRGFLRDRARSAPAPRPARWDSRAW